MRATATAAPLLLVASSVLASEETPLKILFVGNSFTYGPPPYDREDQTSLSNLPRMFKLVAESMGQPVLIGEDTIGGCSLYMHRPSVNAEACDVAAATPACQLVDNLRVNASRHCTTPPDIDISDDAYHSCPQLLSRQPYGAWDVVVLQDHSALPTVEAARVKMQEVALAEYLQTLSLQGAAQPGWTKPLIASYMTWSYYNGTMTSCPGGDKEGCFPLGSLDELSSCNETSDYWDKVRCHSDVTVVICHEREGGGTKVHNMQ